MSSTSSTQVRPGASVTGEPVASAKVVGELRVLRLQVTGMDLPLRRTYPVPVPTVWLSTSPVEPVLSGYGPYL